MILSELTSVCTAIKQKSNVEINYFSLCKKQKTTIRSVTASVCSKEMQTGCNHALWKMFSLKRAEQNFSFARGISWLFNKIGICWDSVLFPACSLAKAQENLPVGRSVSVFENWRFLSHNSWLLFRSYFGML